MRSAHSAKDRPLGARPQRDEPALGLVLTGGGARAAYQVGVLKGICGAARGVPFPS
jgi:predicted acylesterase/phospholipase RssA